jgi:hypothetical protein
MGACWMIRFDFFLLLENSANAKKKKGKKNLFLCDSLLLNGSRTALQAL